MPILRKFVCNVCHQTFIESEWGKGAPNWGQLIGIELDGSENPTLCPNHLAIIAKYLDDLKRNVQ